MAESESKQQSAVNAVLKGEHGRRHKGLGGIVRLLAPVGIAILAGAGGHFAVRLGIADSGTETDPPETAVSVGRVAGGDYIYYDIRNEEKKSLVVNLRSQGTTRFLKAGLSLVVSSENEKVAEETFKKNDREIKDWLIAYLSDLAPDDIVGTKNITRIKRDMVDLLNQRLWPDQRPLIASVVFKEWLAQ